MDSTALTRVMVLDVSATDALHDRSRSAVEKLGDRVKGIRAVKAESKRFAEEVVANPSLLEIVVRDVVGFCTPRRDQPNYFEPLVLQDGKPTPLSFIHMDAQEWWVATDAELSRKRDKIISRCARKLAEEMLIGDAIFYAVELADQEDVITHMGCDARKLTVDIYPDDDGKTAKRLPKWITVEHPPPGSAS